MSRRESISRCNLIIKKLRRAPASYLEIATYLEQESVLQEYDFNVSQRTFQRDLTDIRSIYNIDIQYDFSLKHYFIEFDLKPEINERIMEAFDIFNALNLSERISGYIDFEKKRPQFTENIYGLIHAIENHSIITFTYHKYYDEEVSVRTAEPYGIREFRNRWYLQACDLKDETIKSFALDRLSDFIVTSEKYKASAGFDVNDYFKHSFGIMCPDSEQPQEVILSFESLQGKYIKSLPLHESQEIHKDDENELIVKLNIFITHDFLMELLSFGADVKVIKPDSLIAELKTSYQDALNLY
jgi:predicted DNA-binding transcriptional regulator YafY